MTRGLHSTKVAYLLLTPRPQVWFPAFPKFFAEENLSMLLNQRRWLEESGQWLVKFWYWLEASQHNKKEFNYLWHSKTLKISVIVAARQFEKEKIFINFDGDSNLLQIDLLQIRERCFFMEFRNRGFRSVPLTRLSSQCPSQWPSTLTTDQHSGWGQWTFPLRPPATVRRLLRHRGHAGQGSNRGLLQGRRHQDRCWSFKSIS